MKMKTEIITITPSPFKRPPEIEAIRKMTHNYAYDPELDDDPGEEDATPAPFTEGAFISKLAAEWMDESIKVPDAKMLFDKFWYERELCILFADTNLGKSVLAVQLGDCISKGLPLGPFVNETGPQRVVYLDLELTAKQFQSRYTDQTLGNYPFADFLRAVINPDDTRSRKFSTYHEYLLNGIENLVITDKPDVLIIDNITCLRTSTFAVSSALNLMKNLHRIKSQYNLSVMVLAHTPKRNAAQPVTLNDLQGSKMLINFADSAFAIGQSRTDLSLRYLKQIKQRNTVQVYGETNVCLCRIVKPANFLMFEFKDFDNEINHVQKQTELHRREAEAEIERLYRGQVSIRQIANFLDMSVTTVHRIVTRLKQVPN